MKKSHRHVFSTFLALHASQEMETKVVTWKPTILLLDQNVSGLEP